MILTNPSLDRTGGGLHGYNINKCLLLFVKKLLSVIANTFFDSFDLGAIPLGWFDCIR